MRRAVLLAAAVLLTVEALVFAVLGWVMGLAVRRQQMSIGGLSTDAMAIGAWTGPGVLAVFLVACGAVAARIGLRAGRVSGERAVRVVRGLLIGCAVLHALLGAVLLGLAGVPVFAALMVVLGVLVLAVLVVSEPENTAGAAPVDPPAPPRTPPPATGGPQPV